MLVRLLTSYRAHRWIITAASVIGLVLVVAINNGHAGVVTFLSITAAESGVFVIIYGLRSDWRRVPAARAVFYAVFGYCTVATSQLSHAVWNYGGWWWDNLRELTYLFLAVAGLNLVLVLTRTLGSRVWRDR